MLNTAIHEAKEIIVCPECNGTGKTYAFDQSGHPLVRGGKPVITICPVCDGQRVLLKKTTVEYFAIPQQVFEEPVKDKKGGILTPWRKKQ